MDEEILFKMEAELRRQNLQTDKEMKKAEMLKVKKTSHQTTKLDQVV